MLHLTSEPAGHVRLFVAARPPAEVVDALGVPDRVLSGDLRPVRPDHMHVTLRFLGDADPATVSAALRRADLRPAHATLARRASVLGRSALVVPVRDLDDLATVVREATGDLGDQSAERAFKGHLTLARRRGSVGSARVLAALDAWLATTPALHFEVEEVELISSFTAAAGVVYEVLERFPVATPGGNHGNLPGNA